MARSIVLGNGNMLVSLDPYGQVRDFYYPYVGLENHIGRTQVHKLGVYTEGRMSWISDADWKITTTYQDETMASAIFATNDSLGVKLSLTDIVYNEKNIFVRKIHVENLWDAPKQIKLFFNQQFQISATTHADTAYYNPAVESIIHYKGRRVFLIGGQYNGRPFDEYSVGLYGIEGKDGTWRDAEDGMLSKNTIEHGVVDSIVGFSLDLQNKGSGDVFYWITTGQTFREVQALQRYLLTKTANHLLESTQDYWHAWVNKVKFTFNGLDGSTVRLFKNSLFVMRAHSDNHGGILASGDSDNFQYGRDTYEYIWPRDGAYVAEALDKAGHSDISQKFFSFVNDLVTDEGYLMHKYQPDKSLGSSWHPWMKDGKSQLAIQEDETATVIFMLWEHYKVAKDLEFIENVYNNLVKKCIEFLIIYREEGTGLPASSYDLWEEKFGISTYTASSVYGAFIAASNFAELLGKDDDKDRYRAEAEKIKQAVLKHLYVPERNNFWKILLDTNGKWVADETTDVSSFFGPYKFGLLPPEDEKISKAFNTTMEKLSCVVVEGIARYENDKYFASVQGAPGNPWFITTLWTIQYKIERATNEDDMKKLSEQISRLTEHSTGNAILAEQFHPLTGEPISESPLAWSHAEFVLTVIAYMQKRQRLGLGEMVKQES